MRFFLYSLVCCSLLCLVFAQEQPCIDDSSNCADTSYCTDDYCNTDTGFCGHDDVYCDDYNACTTDGCDPGSGCTITTIPCTDTDLCTVNSCDAETGCYFPPLNCADTDPCTTDSCDQATGQCIHPNCPSCVQSTSNGIDLLCNGTTQLSSLTADSINTGSLTVTGGSKKRGVGQNEPALRVEGGASFTGGLTTTELSTNNFVTNTITITGSLTIITAGGGGGSFDLSKGISTKDINCTSLKVDGPTTVNSLNVNSNAAIGNLLTTKDATVTGTINTATIHFTPPVDKLWMDMGPGTVFSLPAPINPLNILGANPGYKVYLVGGSAADPKLYSLMVENTDQLGKKNNPCFLGKCQTGSTCINQVCK